MTVADELQAAATAAVTEIARLESLVADLTRRIIDLTQPPPPPPALRRPVYAWGSATALDQITGNPRVSAVSPAVLRGLCAGLVMSEGRIFAASASPLTDPLRATRWARAKAAGFDVFPSTHFLTRGDASETLAFGDDTAFARVRSHLTLMVDKAVELGLAGFGLDVELYGSPNVWRTTNPALMYGRGQDLGAIYKRAGPLQIYMPSGEVGWPGSWNDAVQTSNGRPNVFVGNQFASFIDGLVYSGCQVNLIQATFHNGYGPAKSWEEGFVESTRRIHARFPTGVTAGVMLWPDRDENSPPWKIAEMKVAFEAATRACTGPVILYQHTIATDGAFWLPMLTAIKTAVSG